MFNGSENAPGDYFAPLREIGRDRLQRHHLVRPHQLFRDRAARRRSSARCSSKATGWAICSARSPRRMLDNQLGVVQNEKRQGDNEPYGMVEYAQLEALFPRRPSLSSLDDRLDGRSRRRHAGDGARLVPRAITARTTPSSSSPATSTPPRRGRSSSAISATFRAGRSTIPAAADVPTLPRRIDRVMHDRVANTRLYRNWVVPGLTAEDHGAAHGRRDHPRRPRPARGSTTPWCAASRARSRVTRRRPAVPPDQPVRGHRRREARPGRRRGVAPARRSSSPISSAPARPPTRCAAR